MNTTHTNAALALTLAAASVAHAGVTAINTSPTTGRSLASIMNELYTGSNAEPSGNIGVQDIGVQLDFGNSVYANRIQDTDSLGGIGSALPFDLGNGSGRTDQNWLAGNGTIEVIGRYSTSVQSLSLEFTSAGTSTGLPISFAGNSTLTTDDPDSIEISAGSFRWIRSNGIDPDLSSEASLNANAADRMVAFEIDSSNPDARSFIIAFETGDDNAFNDLVVEFVITLIPLPTGAAMGMAGMGLLAIRRRGAR
jgi:hypothetical protein